VSCLTTPMDTPPKIAVFSCVVVSAKRMRDSPEKNSAIFIRGGEPLAQGSLLANPEVPKILSHGCLFCMRRRLGKPPALNFEQFVEGRRWWPWAREGLEEARVVAGDEPCNGEERRRASVRFDALQSVIK
jgi:hypothetical protein